MTAAHPLLDNIAWHSLAGAQSGVAVGSGAARRYAPGFSPIVGFADPLRPDFAALEPHCAPGEPVYCAGSPVPLPEGWRVHAQALLNKMVWEAPLPADEDDAGAGFDVRPLRAEHLAQILDLVTRTQPGPFGPRTIELGDYLGCFDGPRLVAMAGERMFAPPLREISGVCTDPGFRGRGLAARLIRVLVRRAMQRGETPFLHVMHDNAGARSLYERMGFVDRQQQPLRVISRGG